MYILRIVVFFTTVAIPIITAVENDQVAETNKNINLYLVPPPGLKSFLSDYKQTVSREPGTQYVEYVAKSEPSEDEKIALKVIKEDQNSYVVQSNNNDADSDSQHQPKLRIVNSEDPNIKYALEPEGPNQTKVTVKVIKEHRKTFAVDPSYIENKPDAPEYNKPEIIYKTTEPKYIHSQSVYKRSNPEYTKYETKSEEPKQENVFVKVVEEDQNTLFTDSKYNRDNTYGDPEYRKIKSLYKNSELIPEFEYKTLKIKEEEPREKDIYVKVVKENKNAFDFDTKSKHNDLEYKKIITEYRKTEPDYVKFEVKREEPRVFVKDVKKDRTADTHYKNTPTHLEPLYRKSVTEYEHSEPEYKQLELNYHKHKDNEKGNKGKEVFVKVVKEDNKSFAHEKSYLEPLYKTSVTEYRKSDPHYRHSKPDYDKYEDNHKENREKEVYVKVIKEDKKTLIDSKYKNDNKYAEPEYTKSITEYEKSEPDYRVSDSDDEKYNVKVKEIREQQINEDQKMYVENSKFTTDNNYFAPQHIKPASEYARTEPADVNLGTNDEKLEDKEEQYDNRYNESENNNSEQQSEFDLGKYDQHDEEPKDKKVLAKQQIVKFNGDSTYKQDDTHLEPENRKIEKEYKRSESMSSSDNKFGEPKHDVLIKIWSNKS